MGVLRENGHQVYLPLFFYLGRVGDDDHSLFDGRRAGRNQVVDAFNPDEADFAAFFVPEFFGVDFFAFNALRPVIDCFDGLEFPEGGQIWV